MHIIGRPIKINFMDIHMYILKSCYDTADHFKINLSLFNNENNTVALFHGQTHPCTTFLSLFSTRAMES